MASASGLFILYLFATLVIYYLLPRRPQNLLLLFVSNVFCISRAWEFALVLLVGTAAKFPFGQRQGRGKQEQHSLLWLGRVFNILTLASFKTADFYQESRAHSQLLPEGKYLC